MCNVANSPPPPKKKQEKKPTRITIIKLCFNSINTCMLCKYMDKYIYQILIYAYYTCMTSCISYKYMRKYMYHILVYE